MPGYTLLHERHMVRAADSLDHIAPHAEIAQRLEPHIKDFFRGFAFLPIEPVGRSGARVVIDIDRNSLQIISAMSFNPSARSEKTLLLSTPQDRTYRSTGNRVDRREESHGLHYGRHAVSVVRRAGGGVPGIEGERRPGQPPGR